jgi:1-acyl-sn-glycerol-3-phosphate acyltransferase
LTKLRGYIAFTLILLGLLLFDPVQRLLVAPWARMAPSRRVRTFSRWQRFLAHFVLRSVARIGGAKMPAVPRIDGRAGVLVLMNHQSVLDIPLMVAAVHGSYPRIVTRKRYHRWIPLISHLVRLYQYPVVDPKAGAEETRRMVDDIAEAARTSDVPMGIFPEGTRTRDGEIGRFRPRGLRAMLEQRPWEVHVLVADGFWERAKLRGLLGGWSTMRGKIVHLGPFAWNDPTADPEPFMGEMRERMVAALAELRSEVPAA